LVPDQIVGLTWRDIAGATDPIMEAALKRLA
jgi:hypothetical protein